MPDMLVKLYELPPVAPLIDQMTTLGIEIRRADPWEKRIITEWIEMHFSQRWAITCEVALEQRPVTGFIAVEKDRLNDDPHTFPAERLVGFACYDVASKGMFGPTGVLEEFRGRGIGTALLLTCLHTMHAERYAYAIISRAGPVEFYVKTVGATVIEGSDPGMVRRKLHG